MTAQDRLQKTIAEYESDTFSAEGSEITADEALFIAEELITMWAEHHLDGVIITEFLEEKRAK